eukprot:c20649_g1_i2.p1 GENE.c20649_g1_i2~~c20649_g1_i2.p1  ORF type:complete len:456 (+),score=94.41 c20649_g1_i2:207-1574(+)
MVNKTETANRYKIETERFADAPSLSTFTATIVNQCRDVLQRHEKQPVDSFKNDQEFRATIGEMLDVKTWAKEKFSLWFHDQSLDLLYFDTLSLRDAHRKWVQHIVRSKGLNTLDGATEYLKARGRVTKHINEVNSDGEACVESGAADGGWDEVEIIALLLASDPSSFNKALFTAARNGNADWVRALLRAQTDPNKCRESDGASPLWIAAANGHARCIEALIAAGADVNKPRNNVTPLWIAAINGHAECINLLVGAGGDVNQCDDDDVSPLYVATQNGHIDCVRALIQAGGDVNKCNNDGVSPIYAAAEFGQEECIRMLIASGSRVDPLPPPVMTFCASCDVTQEEVAFGNWYHLPGTTSDLSVEGWSQTPPEEQANYKKVDRVEDLGPDACLYCHPTTRPLMIAAWKGNLECVTALADGGADLETEFYGWTAAGIARATGHEECAAVMESYRDKC